MLTILASPVGMGQVVGAGFEKRPNHPRTGQDLGFVGYFDQVPWHRLTSFSEAVASPSNRVSTSLDDCAVCNEQARAPDRRGAGREE